MVAQTPDAVHRLPWVFKVPVGIDAEYQNNTDVQVKGQKIAFIQLTKLTSLG